MSTPIFPPNRPFTKKRCFEWRAFIRTQCPNAEEVISYGMPAFKETKVLVYYEAFKNHVGFYPTAAPIVRFEEELKASGLTFSKGAVQLPLTGVWPEALLIQMIAYRQEVAGVKVLRS
ncbi:MAG TPA: hypothetical protein DCZ44_02165 [Flavobacteriaceae bacterium]|nr:hypothetical protein [Flavobacteriaceae bacterium]